MNNTQGHGKLISSAALFSTLLLFSSYAFSVTFDPNLLVHNVGLVADIVEYISIAMGIGLILSGLFKLKRYGEMRTMMSMHITIAAPLMMLLGGTMLLLLPTVIGSSLLAFWGTTSPLAIPTTGAGDFDKYMLPIVMFVRLVGVISFVRGVLMIARLGKEGQQPGTGGKALMHMIGGILCIHIVGTYHLVIQVLGFAGA